MKSDEVKFAEQKVKANLDAFDRSVDELMVKIEETKSSVSQVVLSVREPLTKIREMVIGESGSSESARFIAIAAVGVFCALGFAAILHSQYQRRVELR